MVRRPFPGHLEIGRAVLVAVGVAADDDRLRPTGDEARHVLADDRLAEDDAAQNVADRAVRALPHLLEMELFDARLIGRDRRAFDADAAGLDRLGGVDRHLVVGRVAMLDRKVEIVELDVQIGMDELVADEVPDDARHLVAVELDNRILDLDLGHRREFPVARSAARRCSSPYSIGSLSGKAHAFSPRLEAAGDRQWRTSAGGRVHDAGWTLPRSRLSLGNAPVGAAMRVLT